MKLTSMTGMGRASSTIFGREIAVEIRSVNHRFCEVNVRSSANYAVLDPLVIQAVKKFVQRGKIEVFIKEWLPGARSLHLNTQGAGDLIRTLNRLKKKFGLAGEVDLLTLSFFRDLLFESTHDVDPARLWPKLKVLINRAMQTLVAMRSQEGAHLGRAMKLHVAGLEKIVHAIGVLSQQAPVDYQSRLQARLAQIDPRLTLDPVRLATEVALLADRCDISEELTRLASHLQQLTDKLAGRGPVGREMDFLLQEFNREFNTLGSKAADATIAQKVVAAKTLLEKVREQVQNIE